MVWGGGGPLLRADHRLQSPMRAKQTAVVFLVCVEAKQQRVTGEKVTGLHLKLKAFLSLSLSFSLKRGRAHFHGNGPQQDVVLLFSWLGACGRCASVLRGGVSSANVTVAAQRTQQLRLIALTFRV